MNGFFQSGNKPNIKVSVETIKPTGIAIFMLCVYYRNAPDIRPDYPVIFDIRYPAR
jgi:hypothetical protein